MKDKIDVRTRNQMSQLRTILRMRVNLLDKDLGRDKSEQVNKVIDELTLTQLNKLRNATTNIADKILAEFAKDS